MRCATSLRLILVCDAAGHCHFYKDIMKIQFAIESIVFSSHGKTVTDDVSEITWTATAKMHGLPDAHYDEFVLRGGLPAAAGPMWFQVMQTCEKGSIDWAEVPATGASTQGLKFPAALLEVIESGAAGHQH